MNTEAISAPDSGTESNPAEDTTIYIGDTVKVKRGVLDPDIENARERGEWWDSVSLAGWVGIVTDIDEQDDGSELVTLEWDSRTLRGVPDRWLTFCSENGAETGEAFGFMVLGIEDVKLSKARDTAADRARARHRIEAGFEWEDRVEELCDEIGLSKEREDDGDIRWTVMTLRENGDAMEIGIGQHGLRLLREAHETHTLDLLPGDYRVNGRPRGNEKTTLISIAAIQSAKIPALIVRAHWDDIDDSGDEVEIERDIVVGLKAR